MKRASNGVREDQLEHPIRIIARRGEFGNKETMIRLCENINERGIRAAGDRFLPLYGLAAFVCVIALLIFVRESGYGFGPLRFVVRSILLLGFLALWVVTPVLIYWDSAAAERYLRERWDLGKLNAIFALFIGPAALVLQILYRSLKR